MKKFIVKTLLFILPVAASLAPIEYLLRKIPNVYTYKKSYLDEHAEEIRVLILGSSHTYSGIDPSYFPQNAFNAAHAAQSFDFDFEIFNKYLEKFKELKVVILPVSYFSLWHKMSNDQESRRRVKNYVLYYGIDAKPKRITDRYELLNGRPIMNLHRFYNYYFMKKDDIICTPLGHGTDFSGTLTVTDVKKAGEKEARRERARNAVFGDRNEKIFAENIKIMDAFAEICRQNNIRLILITTPLHHTSNENSDMEQWGIIEKTITDFTQKHDGVRYLNLRDDPDFTAEDFHDASHLNGSGAGKLSVKLASYIDSLGIFGAPD